MALDGCFLRHVKSELESVGLIGARVEKIRQPSRDEVLITFRTRECSVPVLFCANSDAARVCLCEDKLVSPATPPMFCQMARKWLSGGRVTEIVQDGFERIIDIYFDSSTDIGDRVKTRLSAEVIGRASNLILSRLDEIDGKYKIIDAVKRMESDFSARALYPGAPYYPPKKDFRARPDELSPAVLAKILEDNYSEKLVGTLVKNLEGLSPVFARECALYAAKDCDALCGDILGGGKLERVLFFVKNSLENPVFTAVSEKRGNIWQYREFSFVGLTQYGGADFLATKFDTPSELLNGYFSGKAAAARAKQQGYDIMRALVNITDRITRRIAQQKQDLINSAGRESLKERGDLLMSNLYRLDGEKKGQTEVKCADFADGADNPTSRITVQLDPKLSVRQNALLYYAKYKKMATAEKKLAELIKSGEEELAYIESVFDAAGRAADEREFAEIRDELAETGFLRQSRQALSKKGAKQEKPLPPIKESVGGAEVLIGRNNRQNDRLTLKTAKGDDLWLHVKDAPGAHVIVRANGAKVAEKVVGEAAKLAARYSKLANSQNVPVDVCFARFVKKAPGAKPGMVIYSHNKTLYVTP